MGFGREVPVVDTDVLEKPNVPQIPNGGFPSIYSEASRLDGGFNPLFRSSHDQIAKRVEISTRTNPPLPLKTNVPGFAWTC